MMANTNVQNTPSGIQHYKIVLIGEGNVGKTTFLKRLLTQTFEDRYIATLGVELGALDFRTNYGYINFNMWDTAGQEKFGGLKDGYYVGASGVIVMFDVTSRPTYDHVSKWIIGSNTTTNSIITHPTPTTFEFVNRGIQVAMDANPNMPIVICGNKIDSPMREVEPHQIDIHHTLGHQLGKDIPYYDISTKYKTNLEKPLLHLLRKITGHDDLVFIEAPDVQPPTYIIG